MKTRKEHAADWVNTLPGIRPTDQFYAADRRVFEALVERLLAFADAEAAAMRERAGLYWQPIATVRSQEEVLVCNNGLLGWWAVAIQNALGEWHYADRHEPLKYVPTHWQAVPSIYPIRALPATGEVGRG